MNHSYLGGGVFRFEDGSLLMVTLTQGSDCLQFTPAGPVGLCTRTFKITGGTGRLKNASGGTIFLAETVSAVVFDGSMNPVFFATAGQMTVSGVTPGGGPNGD
jgi:hypothetical protein